MQPGLQALQSRLQHVFSDPSLLQRATTHRSFSADHNERLEFLGDSVLNLAVAIVVSNATFTQDAEVQQEFTAMEEELAAS